MLVKGSVFINSEQKLLTLDLNKPLANEAEKFYKEHNLNISRHAFLITRNRNNVNLGNYLTEANKLTLLDGFSLELVFSIEYLVKRIFMSLRIENHSFFGLSEDTYERKQIFDDLYKLAPDPAFIKFIIDEDLYGRILQIMEAKKLVRMEAAACLLTFLHLLKVQAISEVQYDQFKYLLHLATKEDNNQEIHLAYSVLCQLLYQRHSNFKIVKEAIVNNLSITRLLERLRCIRDNKELDSNTLQLINAMVRAVQGDIRINLVREMKKKSNRQIIHEIILSKPEIKKNTAHELYAYQTYVLSLHKDTLTSYIDPSCNRNFKDIFELDEELPRSSILYDFESAFIVKRSTSQDTILSNDDNRISLASLKSIRTVKSTASLCSDDFLEDKLISYLTVECLTHFKNNYQKNFCQSQNEAAAYESDIFMTAERVTKLLARVLRIGKEPIKHGQNYQPLIFNTEFQHDFFPELFSRIMWLLSKTRREMRGTAPNDYDKVLKILKKQVEMILCQKPKTYKELEQIMKTTNYSVVSKELEAEYQRDIKKVLDTNPSVQELKETFSKANEQLIYQQKMRILQSGQPFPKLPMEKKREQYVKYELSNNKKIFYYGDWDNTLKKYTTPKSSFNVSEIKHFLVGQACPHVKDGSVKKHTQAFTVLLENETKIDFYAPDERTANNWIDGFHLLLGKTNRSVNYKKDMETLVEMDCMLQLMELQGIRIPFNQPPIPSPPEVIKPVIPPRSPKLLAKLAKYKSQNANGIHLENDTTETTI